MAGGGGVILNQPPLYDAFARRLGALLPETAVHRLDVPPVQGALVIAERLAGRNAGLIAVEAELA